MTAWQRTAIAIARSRMAKTLAQPVIGRTLLARRFIAYGTVNDSVSAALALHSAAGITASLFYLGEYIDDPARAEETVSQTCRAASLLGVHGLDVHVSIDPTAIGYLTSEQLCRRNAERVAHAVASNARGHSWVMLDMEDLSVLEPTLALLHHLLAQDLPAAITLQARLRRTRDDLAPLLEKPTSVRLVKGAFPLGPEHDYQGSTEISRNFLSLASMMLSPAARKAGFYPSFGTHDDVLAREVIKLARANGWQPDQYEIEFLYGVRTPWQRELRNDGVAVRVYLPFGTDWWPYVMRRIGENPRNLLLVQPRSNSLLVRGYTGLQSYGSLTRNR
ncbi:MAG: proline dehydrogenase [Streptosporangiaceae bacterium]|jgi:proline dehydrogenase|nr:proline dehydrogenase [Streptosporangiaceae bacterium]